MKRKKNQNGEASACSDGEQPHAVSPVTTVRAGTKRSRFTKHQSDADYWQSRADRTKLQANRFRHHTRDHLMKVAAGYEQLAQNARGIGDKPDL